MDRLDVMITIKRTDDAVQASALTHIDGVDYIVQSGPMQWGGDAAELALAALMVQVAPAVTIPASPEPCQFAR